jgi:hypothetical protein
MEFPRGWVGGAIRRCRASVIGPRNRVVIDYLLNIVYVIVQGYAVSSKWQKHMQNCLHARM